MSRHSIRSDAGVEMYLMAPKLLGLGMQPGEQRLCVPLLPCSWQSGEIVNIEMVTPGEVVCDAEAGHGERRRPVVRYGADQAVTGGPLPLIHLSDELVLGSQSRPEFTHRVEGATGMWREQLDDHDWPSCQRALQRRISRENTRGSPPSHCLRLRH